MHEHETFRHSGSNARTDSRVVRLAFLFCMEKATGFMGSIIYRSGFELLFYYAQWRGRSEASQNVRGPFFYIWKVQWPFILPVVVLEKKKKHYSAKTHLPRENGEGINKLMLRKVGGI